MSAFLLLASGDLDLTTGGIRVTTGIQQVMQNVRAAIREFKGEWFLDQTRGLPYYQTILQKGTGKDVIESLYKQAILAAPGVVDVPFISLTITSAQGRVGTLTCTVQCVTGEVTTPITETV